MKNIQIFVSLLFLMTVAVGTGQAQTQTQTQTPASIHGKVVKWNVRNNTMRLTYYPIADFQTYMNTIVSHRKAPDLAKGNKPAVLTLDLPSPESADTIESLFADQYLVIAPDPANKKIILVKIIPGNVMLKRVTMVGYTTE